MDKPLIALFDMDGTLADYTKAINDALEPLKGPGEPDCEDLWKAPGHIKKRMDLIKRKPGWWKALEPIEVGFKVLQIAQKLGFEIRVLTKGPVTKARAWMEKVEWCKKYLPKDTQITITEDKGAVYGRVLVDDSVEFMTGWKKNRPRGLGLMPLYDYNEDYAQKTKNVTPYTEDNLHEVEKHLKKARDRKEGEPLNLG